MPLSSQTYTYSVPTSVSSLVFSFALLPTAVIRCTVDDAAVTAFTVSGQTLTFQTPVTASKIVLQRETPMDALPHDFSGGSMFSYEAVDDQCNTLLSIVQEAKEGTGTASEAAIAAAAAATAAGAAAHASQLASEAAQAAVGTPLQRDSNLSDLGSAGTARTNLGLGSSAILDAPASGNASATQVVKGDDSRLTDARAPTTHTHTVSQISDATTVGRALVTSADAGAALTALSLPTGSAFSFRNKIINGNFTVNQRGMVGAITLSAGQYGHILWKAGASGCTYSVSASGLVSITSGSLIQVVDAENLLSGDYVLSWTGTAQARIDGGAWGGSGIIGTASGANQTVEFGAGTFQYVQYEAGHIAQPFEYRHKGIELLLCQRYFYPFFGGQIALGAVGNGAQKIICAPIYLPTPMRTAPTLLNMTTAVASAPSATGQYAAYNESTGAYIPLSGVTLSPVLPGNKVIFVLTSTSAITGASVGNTINLQAYDAAISAEP